MIKVTAKCDQSPFVPHQRRNKKANEVGVLVTVASYCYWCHQLLEEGPETPVPGDKNWTHV